VIALSSTSERYASLSRPGERRYDPVELLSADRRCGGLNGYVATTGTEVAKKIESSAADEAAGGSIAHETISRVGSRMRARRKEAGLTLSDLASRTGVSVSMLSMLERGLAGPSIGTLVAVASALRLPMHELFDDRETPPASPVTPKASQHVVVSQAGVVRRLAHRLAEDGFEIAVNEYPPGTASAEKATHHSGREYGVLVQGSLVVELDGVEHVLKPGDAIAYDSDAPHRFINRGRTQARAVWLNADK
jgi:transcriptional regulator with XRE-family HTH domain